MVRRWCIPLAGAALVVGLYGNGRHIHQRVFELVEPTGHCTSATRFSSFWVGLDGFNSNSVEQTGSEVDCSGSRPVYFAWYEMFPAAPVNFSNPVAPGDQFFGSVTFNGGSSYTLVLQDITQHWKHTVHKSLSGAANSSAEVIAEAPCCTNSGGILPLANFGTVSFSSASANGSAIGDFSPDQINMIDNSGNQKDSTSALSGGGSFTDTWERANQRTPPDELARSRPCPGLVALRGRAAPCRWLSRPWSGRRRSRHRPSWRGSGPAPTR